MRASILIFAVAAGWCGAVEARWTWDSRAVDEVQLLDEHAQALSTAHENYKRLGRGDAPAPFDPAELARSVALLDQLLNNVVEVGNEAHYAALVERVRGSLDDRIDRTEYEIGRLLESTDADDQARLERIHADQYFALPRLLGVSTADRYRAIEVAIDARVN
ncbi:MAG: hypothetical protein AAGE01_24100 [Pseudomonadota bacterium]